MNHNWILKVYLANFLWRNPLITDFYISIYDTGLDRKWYKSNSLIKKKYLTLKARYHCFLDRLIIEKSTKVIHLTRLELEYIAKLVGARVNKNKVIIR